jgi:quercetin dioxygenase-like cupin family protein
MSITPQSPPRRVVTGHDAAGRSVVLSDGPAPRSQARADGATFHDLWTTAAMPAPIDLVELEDPGGRWQTIAPGPNGTVLRVVELPPGGRSPMHRTQTIDYGIVLSGEVYLVLDDSEVALGAGDIVIQRGTDHAWDNRSAAPARMLFILLDGVFSGDLSAILRGLAQRS